MSDRVSYLIDGIPECDRPLRPFAITRPQQFHEPIPLIKFCESRYELWLDLREVNLSGANLTETYLKSSLFVPRVGYICSLESNGKIPSKQAYRQIKELWKKLEHLKE